MARSAGLVAWALLAASMLWGWRCRAACSADGRGRRGCSTCPATAASGPRQPRCGPTNGSSPAAGSAARQLTRAGTQHDLTRAQLDRHPLPRRADALVAVAPDAAGVDDERFQLAIGVVRVVVEQHQ